MAIFAVIWWHFLNPFLIQEFGLFNVPLFFVVSGFFLSKKKTIVEFVHDKISQLLIPYIITSIGILATEQLYMTVNGTEFTEIKVAFMKRVLALTYGSGSPYVCEAFSVDACGPIWFLLSLFFGIIIVRVCIDFKWGFIPLILCMVVGYITSVFVWLPFGLQAGMVDAGYIYLGYLLKVASSYVKGKINDNNRKMITIIEYIIEIIIMIGCLIIVWLYCNKYDNIILLSCNSFDNGVIDFGTTIVASIGMLLFCKLILDNIPGIKHALAYLGKSTLIILCVHSIDTLIFTWEPIISMLGGLTLETTAILYVMKLTLYIVIVLLWNLVKKLFNTYYVKESKD